MTTACQLPTAHRRSALGCGHLALEHNRLCENWYNLRTKQHTRPYMIQPIQPNEPTYYEFIQRGDQGVGLILRRHEPPPPVVHTYSHADRQTSNAYLLNSYLVLSPTFPEWLHWHRSAGIHAACPVRLWTGFMTSWLWVAYLDHCADWNS